MSKLSAVCPVLLAACLCAGCSRAPQWLPVPPQFTMPSGPEPQAPPPPFQRLLLHIAEPDIDSHIVDGMVPGSAGEQARWTRPRARFRITPPEGGSAEFYVHFFVPRDTFRVTGPGRLTLSIDGKSITSKTFPNPGDHEMRAAAPDGALAAGRELILGLDVDPPYVSPGDGARLGVLLFSIGFRRPAP